MSYQEDRLKRKNGELPPLPTRKEKKPLKRISDKRAAELKAEKKSTEISPEQMYFDYHMRLAKPVCMNCGMKADWLLEDKYKLLWKSCQAHVLPKKDAIGGFPSVAGNFNNHLVLFPSFGGKLCGCHGVADSSWENFAKMKVFKRAVQIVKDIYHLIDPDERKYLPDVFVQEIPPDIININFKS